MPHFQQMSGLISLVTWPLGLLLVGLVWGNFGGGVFVDFVWLVWFVFCLV